MGYKGDKVSLKYQYLPPCMSPLIQKFQNYFGRFSKRDKGAFVFCFSGCCWYAWSCWAKRASRTTGTFMQTCTHVKHMDNKIRIVRILFSFKKGKIGEIGAQGPPGPSGPEVGTRYDEYTYFKMIKKTLLFMHRPLGSEDK